MSWWEVCVCMWRQHSLPRGHCSGAVTVSVGNLSAASISVGSSMSHACRDTTKITWPQREPEVSTVCLNDERDAALYRRKWFNLYRFWETLSPSSRSCLSLAVSSHAAADLACGCIVIVWGVWMSTDVMCAHERWIAGFGQLLLRKTDNLRFFTW